MNKILTAKLKISDHLQRNGVPCLPDYDTRTMLTKLAMITSYKKQMNLLAWQGHNAIIALSHVLDEFGGIRQVDLAACTNIHKKKNSPKKAKKEKERFVFSEWKTIRYKALKVSDGKCCLCGHSAKDGVKLHVDHIKPKSLYPHLALELSNLQVLCDVCNVGKGNKDDTDWR